MKIRTQLVANSSTVSFVVMFDKENHIIHTLSDNLKLLEGMNRLTTEKEIRDVDCYGDSLQKCIKWLEEGKFLYIKTFDNNDSERIDDFENTLSDENIEYIRFAG